MSRASDVVFLFGAAISGIVALGLYQEREHAGLDHGRHKTEGGNAAVKRP